MTPQQVRTALDIYEKALKAAGAIPERADLTIKSPSVEVHRNHILWMCGETHKILDTLGGGPGDREDRFILEKAMRWLGFVQDGLWVVGIYSIEEMKDHNR